MITTSAIASDDIWVFHLHHYVHFIVKTFHLFEAENSKFFHSDIHVVEFALPNLR
jgi:hypothetical protein